MPPTRLLFLFLALALVLAQATDVKKIRRRVRKKDTNATVSVSVSVSEAKKPTSTFLQHRRALFDRLNKPLLKNRSLDSTISKLRSRLGSVVEKKPKNDSMIMIPIPESQRKPYQPVIMQMAKSNESVSSTQKPDTKVITYKLNKMFVPLGIYGKVVENSTQVDVQHKGSERKAKDHSGIADTIDITYDYRVNVDKVSITEKPIDISKVSLTKEAEVETSVSGNRRHGQSQMQTMSAPVPLPASAQQGSFLDKLKSTASNLPGLFHKGITSLSQLTSSYNHNPFHDENFDTYQSGSHYSGQTVQPSQNQNQNQNPKRNKYETLEYFRNRPISRSAFKQPKSVSGFHPVTAPAHMASEYFASATTPVPTSVKPTAPIQEWKDYLFPQEYTHTSSWRDYFGLEAIQPNTHSPTYNSNILQGSRRADVDIDHRWSKIRSKYTQKQMDTARESVFDVFNGGQPTKKSEAFEDLMGMFQLVFNVGRGRSVNKMRDFSHVGHVKSSEKVERVEGRSGDWKPVDKTISFSAGVSFPSRSKPVKESSLLDGIKQGVRNHMTSLADNYMTSGSVVHEQKVQQPRKVDRPVSDDDNPYELVPSEEYFKNPNLGEIAAVVKPSSVSDDIVQRQFGDLPTFTYGGNRKSLNDLQSYLSTWNKQQAKVYQQKESTYVLPQKYYETETDQVHLIKAELDGVKHSFDNRRSDMISNRHYKPVVKQHHHQLKEATFHRRPVTKFFAPIPISPTTMSQTIRGRYQSPVPRYVVELAKKLQRDKDVQGIVRVSTRRSNGPPIEYLYPVRG